MIEIKGILFGTYPLLRKHVLLSEYLIMTSRRDVTGMMVRIGGITPDGALFHLFPR